MRQTLRSSLMTMVVLASTLAAHARAGFIQNHGAVHAYGVIVGPPTATSASGQAVGPGDTTTGVVSVASHLTDFLYGNTTYTLPQDLGGQAEAHTRAEAAHLLAASASALGQPAIYGFPFTSPPSGGRVVTESQAAWTDIAFVNGPQRPNSLNLTFSVSGVLTANPGQIYGGSNGLLSEAQIGISWDYHVADFSKVPDGPISFGFGAGNAQVGLINSQLPPGWTITNGVLSGTTTIQIPYDPKLGGYGFAIALGTNAEADPATYAASATSLFSDTLALTSVTGPDGKPVAVTFDSGLTLASVPEPGSLTLLGVGLLGAAGWSARSARRGSLSR